MLSFCPFPVRHPLHPLCILEFYFITSTVSCQPLHVEPICFEQDFRGAVLGFFRHPVNSDGELTRKKIGLSPPARPRAVAFHRNLMEERCNGSSLGFVARMRESHLGWKEGRKEGDLFLMLWLHFHRLSSNNIDVCNKFSISDPLYRE